MLSVVMLNVTNNPFLLSVVMLNVIMLSDVALSKIWGGGGNINRQKIKSIFEIDSVIKPIIL
jgi:hypothetical protein